MYESAQVCPLLNDALIIRCLGILREVDNLHGDLTEEGLALHLHSSLPVHLVPFARNLIIVPGRLFGKSIVAVVDFIGENIVHWSDNC